MGLEFGTGRNQTVWQPEPRGRGTYGLVSSCVLTMVLCIWTAVHLNLPKQRKRDDKSNMTPQTVRKVGWLLMGLFAPELVVWTAFEQHREARAVYHSVKKASGEELPCLMTERLRRWVGWRIGGTAETDAEKNPDDGRVLSEDSASAVRTPRTSTSSERVGVGNRAGERTRPAAEEPQRRWRHEWTVTHSYYAIMGAYSPSSLRRLPFRIILRLTQIRGLRFRFFVTRGRP